MSTIGVPSDGNPPTYMIVNRRLRSVTEGNRKKSREKLGFEPRTIEFYCDVIVHPIRTLTEP